MIEDAAFPFPVEWLAWAGIAVCITQSAMFSGLNLAVFSPSRLRLEVEAAGGSSGAQRVLQLRRSSNQVLTTILWGNVGINVLLALLSDSVMTGVAAFVFSTILITILGEIVPQAYFSRHALRMTARLFPLLRFYMFVLWPVARPSAWMLDVWLGVENPQFYRERDLRELIRQHVESAGGDIDRLEGIGALNFLAIDDLHVREAGTRLSPGSLVRVPFDGDRPRFPDHDASPEDPFLRQLHAGGRRWVVLTDQRDEPRLLLDADGYLRDTLFGRGRCDPASYLFRPAVVRDRQTLLGSALARLEAVQVEPGRASRTEDVILVWGETPMLITGDDVLRLLMGGIAAGRPARR